ncbi:MAG: ATP-binding cassette domain-containing protein [Azospirillaceae bacterium]|nr:ATP-binding cassette domain-containing protein [Azospirillaceae bacterium]
MTEPGPVVPLLMASRLRRSFSAGASRFILEIEGFTLVAGSGVAVVGPSGCGKSSLLAVLSLALAPDAATDPAQALMLAGQDVLALWRRRDTNALTRLRADTIGFVPQTAALLPFLSLHDNIVLPQRILGRLDPVRVAVLAQGLRIEDILDRKPAQVSVGQRQRAAVARALAHRPRLVLADEPTASVHPAQAEEILHLLAQVIRDTGAALVITTHDAARARDAGFAIAPFQPAADGITSGFTWYDQRATTAAARS